MRGRRRRLTEQEARVEAGKGFAGAERGGRVWRPMCWGFAGVGIRVEKRPGPRVWGSFGFVSARCRALFRKEACPGQWVRRSPARHAFRGTSS
jgi:hypothetical protein